MLGTKVKLIGLVVFVSAVLGILAGFRLYAKPAQQGGRLLSDRDMATIFGDVTSNGMCSSAQDCYCTRVSTLFTDSGQISACTLCDDNDGDGLDTPWALCCKGDNLYCEENGSAACNLLDVWFKAQFTQSNQCCGPCTATGWADYHKPCSTATPRFNANGRSQACN